jgi:hypothetical protein
MRSVNAGDVVSTCGGLRAAWLCLLMLAHCQGIPTIEPRLVDAGPPVCIPQSILATENVPNMYFVLDHSGSMVEHNKWTTVRNVVSQLITELGSNARFGAAMFPQPAADSCDPGVEVLPLQLGDSTGKLANALLQATGATPNGGTPTAQTLTNLLPELAGFPGSTFVILATDGGANCDPNISCSLDDCTLNIDATDMMCSPSTPPNCCDPSIGGGTGCLDTQATVAAVSALKAAKVPTYVIGIEGSAPYEAMLDQLAQAGGTARETEPLYYRVDSTDASALEMVLAQVAAKITATCQVTLSTAPSDLTTLVVQEGGISISQDPDNGWTVAGTTLTLHGTSCEELLAGMALGLTVTDGCAP